MNIDQQQSQGVPEPAPAIGDKPVIGEGLDTAKRVKRGGTLFGEGAVGPAFLILLAIPIIAIVIAFIVQLATGSTWAWIMVAVVCAGALIASRVRSRK